MKLACVVHRYGPDIAGGSEAHCRHLAERLAERHEVTVLTTRAQDYVTWADAYPEGRSRVNAVDVIRFPVRRPRHVKVFADLSDEVFETRASPERQEAWFLENGPEVPALLDHLRAHGHAYDLVLFWSYRYYTAYFGLPLVADRAVLVPTAEDDPAIRLEVLEAYFKKPAGYLFLTEEEKTIVERRAGVLFEQSAIVGSGLEPTAHCLSRAPLDALGIPPTFLLYLGRIDRNKGCDRLFHYFLHHLAHQDMQTTLVLAGPAKSAVPDHSCIHALGFVDEAIRDALLAYARALVVPSPYESLSIALLEAWNHATPALVNGGCRVLEGQVRRANGGLYYRSQGEFSEALNWLLSHDEGARCLGAQGLSYVEREYRWPIVIDRVERLLDEVRSRRS